MMDRMAACSLSANNFVSSLGTELSKEMGLKSFILVGLLILGIKVIKELLIACKFRVPP
uniref:Uncharacterized protein n=1 Tax=Arundo donax TaxID=35708 RepID=A0A0A9BW22_ARUDO